MSKYCKIIIFGILFVCGLNNGYSQPIDDYDKTAYFDIGIHPTITRGVEFSGGFGYFLPSSNQPYAIFIDLLTDFRSLHNSNKLESGLSADVAVSLNQTDRIKSRISLNTGVLLPIGSSIWVKIGPGFTVFDEFTEHQHKYWVYRDRQTYFNFTAGINHINDTNLILGIEANTTPLSFGFVLGYAFTKQED